VNVTGGLRSAIVLLVLSALSAPAVAADAAPYPPAALRPAATAEVSFDYFEQRLSSFGRWISHPVWGEVWQPDAGRDFRPYFYGYWQFTSDYGWLWVSNEPYGDIVYHYGRWVYDPNFGWLWVPGYVWGPSWVAWRETDGYLGWLPMPPGYQDFSLGAVTPSYGPNDLYGYRYFYGSNLAPEAFAGLWLFVPQSDFGRRDRRPYVIDKDRVRDLYRRSHDRTHYDHDRTRDRIVDRSIDMDELQRSTQRTFAPQAGRQFLRRDTPIVPVTEGQQIGQRDRERNRGRRAAQTELNTPLQNGAALPRTTPPEQDAYGRGSPFFGAPAGPQALGQAGAAPVPGAAIPGVEPPDTPFRRRGGPARLPPAFGAIGGPVAPNIPSTDGLRAPRPLPGIAAPLSPQMGPGPGAPVPAAAPPRTRSRAFGAGIAPAMPSFGAAVSAPAPVLPPAAILAPAPVLPPPVLPAPQAASPSPQRSAFPPQRGF
jgi:hypothetical protein